VRKVRRAAVVVDGNVLLLPAKADADLPIAARAIRTDGVMIMRM